MNYEIKINNNRIIVNKRKKYFKSISVTDNQTAKEIARLLQLVLNDIEKDLGLEDKFKEIVSGVRALVGKTLREDISPLYKKRLANSGVTINKKPVTNQDIIDFFKELSYA